MFSRDFSMILIDVTGVSLYIYYFFTKVTDAHNRKRFRASYNFPVELPFNLFGVLISNLSLQTCFASSGYP